LDACVALEESGISAALYDMRFVKPLDEILLHEVFSKFKHVITVEDGCIQGGMGSAVLEFMADNGYAAQVTRLGIPDKYIEHGTQDELYAECGFDRASMIAKAQEMVGVRERVNQKWA
jgi:1-deoxy-D-xylulose-5-phosphate synthase